MNRNVGGERRVVGVIQSLVNGQSLQVECVRLLNEGLLIFVGVRQ